MGITNDESLEIIVIRRGTECLLAVRVLVEGRGPRSLRGWLEVVRAAPPLAGDLTGTWTLALRAGCRGGHGHGTGAAMSTEMV